MGARVICHPLLHQHAKQGSNEDQRSEGPENHAPKGPGKEFAQSDHFPPPHGPSGRPAHPRARWRGENIAEPNGVGKTTASGKPPRRERSGPGFSEKSRYVISLLTRAMKSLLFSIFTT